MVKTAHFLKVLDNCLHFYLQVPANPFGDGSGKRETMASKYNIIGAKLGKTWHISMFFQYPYKENQLQILLYFPGRNIQNTLLFNLGNYFFTQKMPCFRDYYN